MKNKMRGELSVAGFQAVKELEKVGRREIRRLYLSEETAPLFAALMKKMAAERKPYNIVTDEELYKLSGTFHHEGAVAFIPSLRAQGLTSPVIESFAKNREHVVIIDGVGNTNNFGAVVRSAVFFGIKNVIVRESEQDIAFTTTSFRVAKGAMEYVSVYCVKSIERALKAISHTHCVVGTSLEAKKSITMLQDVCKGRACALILGNEEEGVSDEVLEMCEEVLIIKGRGYMQSLNVAQAASVCFYELTR